MKLKRQIKKQKTLEKDLNDVMKINLSYKFFNPFAMSCVRIFQMACQIKYSWNGRILQYSPIGALENNSIQTFFF